MFQADNYPQLSVQPLYVDSTVISGNAGRTRYPGGKGKYYQRLINLMPSHQTCIEPYLGGGAIMRNEKAAQRNIGLDLDVEVIELWQAKLSGTCELHQVDAVSSLEGYAFKGKELVYVDPPYVPAARRREKVYRCDYTEVGHIRLLRCLVALPCNVMLSGYDCDLYNRESLGWRKMSFPAKTHVETREGVVWMNFPPPSRLHDTRYLGETSRDRQTTQRCQIRLCNRVESSDPIERRELLRRMRELYSNDEEAA